MSTDPNDVNVSSRQYPELNPPSGGNHSNGTDVGAHLAETNSTRFSYIGSTIISSLKWCPTSQAELAAAEAELLKG